MGRAKRWEEEKRLKRKCDVEEQVLLTRGLKPMLVVITIFGKEELRSERMLMVCALWVG